jgi:hypothetical protein
MLVTIVVMFAGALLLNVKDQFDPKDGIFKNNDLGTLFEYVLALMLDPGQLDHLNGGWAHFGSLILAILGIITITGFTISTITNMVQRRVNQYLNGEVRYKNYKDHFVIIGFGPLAITIIEQLLNKYKNNCRILLMSSDDTKEIRQSINTIVKKKDEKYITIYRGRKDTQEDIDCLYIPKAKEVFLIGENNEVNRDASNVESLQVIITSIKKDMKSKPFNCKDSFKRIPVMVLFEYQTTYAAFQITDIAKEWKDYVDFRPFNYYENWAKKLLYTRKYDVMSFEDNSKKDTIYYPSLDRVPITKDSDKRVHLVIFSMSRMGVALGTFAAQVCHFPNFPTKGIKTKISFITPEADTEANFFRGRYARFFEVAPSIHRNYIDGEGEEVEIEPLYKDRKDWLDIEFEFIKGKAEQPEIRKLLSDWAQDDNQILTIAICQRDPSKNMAIGLYLPDIIYEKGKEDCAINEQIPVFIRQKSSGALLTQLRSNSNNTSYRRFSNVYPFGMQDNCYDLEDEDIIKAQLFNSFYYDIYNKQFKKKELKKELYEKWNNLSISHKWSNLYSVYSVKFKLKSLIPYNEENVINYEEYINDLGCVKDNMCELVLKGKTAEMARVEHNRWNVEKLLLGYRTYNDKERDIDNELRKELDNLMIKNGITYADFESRTRPISSELKNIYIKLMKNRKDNEKIYFAHNAILPYDNLDDGNKRYDLFMTGNIPNIFKLFRDIEDDNFNEDEKIYPQSN